MIGLNSLSRQEQKTVESDSFSIYNRNRGVKNNLRFWIDIALRGIHPWGERHMFGQRLKQLRGTRTQDEVAEAIGISRARLSHYENERHEPDGEMYKRFADYYKTSVDYIMGLTDDPAPKDDPSDAEKAKEMVKRILSLPPEKQRLIDDLLKTLSEK